MNGFPDSEDPKQVEAPGNHDRFRRASKFLSLVLRHAPGKAGIALDAEGWTDVDALLAALAKRGHRLSRADLDLLVATNNKKRFAFDPTGARIRASQGHSVAVDLGLEPRVPPETLFHGTVARFLDSIRAQGLLRGSRRHVHLSPDVETARIVGARRGEPVILTVRAGAMHAAGHGFFLSENGVWLTDAAPPEFLIF